MIRAAAIAAALVALTSCFGVRSGVTDDGLALPKLTVEFPASSRAGRIETAVLTIENPGPGDLSGVSVAFGRVGPARGGGALPHPLVDQGARFADDTIVAIDPEPVGISIDGVAFNFSPLPEGESITIRFDIEIPDVSGEAANSILVYDSRQTDRVAGIRLHTEVRG